MAEPVPVLPFHLLRSPDSKPSAKIEFVYGLGVGVGVGVGVPAVEEHVQRKDAPAARAIDSQAHVARRFDLFAFVR